MTLKLIKPIPSQIVNEGASFGPLDLNKYIQSPDADGGSIHFQAELSTGDSLPAGLICTSSGIVAGIPPSGTHGIYTIMISAVQETGAALAASFKLTIQSRIIIETAEEFGKLKQRIWEALGKDETIPGIGDFINRPVTEEDIQYLLQRFATFVIWNVYNLSDPGEKFLLNVPGCSEHFNIYDRGSCLLMAPKDLFSHERTLEDALQTARAMAGVVYERGWTMEFSGFNKAARAAWIELQLLSDKLGRKAEILHYTPSEEDKKLYAAKASLSAGPTF